MTPQETEALIDKLYELTGSGDFAGAEAYLTDDFMVSESDDMPMACVLHGKDALERLFVQVMSIVDVTSLTRHVTMVGKDCAAVHLQFDFADETLEPAELIELFRFRGNKVCEIKPFYFTPSVFHKAAAAKRASV